MLAGALVVLQLQGDCLVDQWTNPVADVAAQPQVVEAGLVIDEHRHPHPCLIDIGHGLIQRPARAGHHAGDVFTHLARDGARLEVGGAGGHGFKQPGELEGVVGAGLDAEPAAHAGAEELGLVEGSWRAQRLDRHGLHLLARHAAEPHAKQAHTAGPLAMSARNWRRLRLISRSPALCLDDLDGALLVIRLFGERIGGVQGQLVDQLARVEEGHEHQSLGRTVAAAGLDPGLHLAAAGGDDHLFTTAHATSLGIFRVHEQHRIREGAIELGTRRVMVPVCQCSSTRPVESHMSYSLSGASAAGS